MKLLSNEYRLNIRSVAADLVDCQITPFDMRKFVQVLLSLCPVFCENNEI